MNELEFEHSNNINLPHLSASTVNKFIEDRFGFYQAKVLRAPFKGNEFTARGKAVEHGVNVWLENPDLGDYLTPALELFDKDIEESGLSKFSVGETRDKIPGLLECALRYYQELFSDQKATTQHSMRHRFDDIELEFLIYLDFFRIGKDVNDCKVVSRTPPKLSQAYVLQGSLYRAATGLPVGFNFIVDNKTPVAKTMILTDDEYVFGISYLKAAAKAIIELNQCSNPKRVMELMSFPNLDALWSHQDKVVAAKAWGIAY